MKINKFIDYTTATWAARMSGVSTTPTLLIGEPGIGKSSACREAAEVMASSMGRQVVDLLVEPEFNGSVDEVVLFFAADLSSKLPEDLGGIPKTGLASICGSNVMVTTHAVQRWAAPFCVPGAVGMLVLDDIAAASPSLQVAARQLILDRKIGDAKLSDGVILVATGNRKQDKSGARTLPAHFLNCVTQLSIKPDLEGWCEWYGSKGLPAIISSFLRFRPGKLSQFPKDGDPKTGAFATPRSWAHLGALWETAERHGIAYEVASGTVGEGNAAELIGFKNTRNELVDPAEVLRNPKTALPDPKAALNSPDRAYAMVTALGEIAAKDPSVTLAFIEALSWVSAGNEEYIPVGLQTWVSNGGHTRALVKECKKHSKNQAVQQIVKHMSAAANL